MITRAGFPFKILDKTFFTQTREEFLGSSKPEIIFRRGFRFLFPLKKGAGEPCEFDHNQFHATWLGRNQVVVIFRKPRCDW